MSTGLHVTAQEYADHPEANRDQLEVASLRASIAYLESTGEYGVEVALILLRQRIDDICGPSIPELRAPEDSGPSGLPWLYARIDNGPEDHVEIRPITMPFYGKRPKI